MWNLQQNAGAIAGVGIGSLCSSMREILQYLESLANDGMRLLPLDIDNKTNPTRVLFVLRIIQPLLARKPGKVHVYISLKS